jgi:hypothetical protein
MPDRVGITDGGSTDGTSDSIEPDSNEDSGRFEPPPRDAALFDGCAPSPCASEQICVDFMPLDHAACDGVPSKCEPERTCACIEQAADWCKVINCTSDGGIVVLTCENSMGSPP